MTYTDMQRFKDALEGTPQDRVPIFPLIAGWAATNFSDFSPLEVASDPQLMVKAQIEAKESMGYDAVFSYVHPLYIPEAFGCKVRFLESGPLVDPLPLEITSVKDIDNVPQPDANREATLPVILEATLGLSAYGNGEIPVVGLFEGPFTTTCRVIEAELIMHMIYKNQVSLERLLDKITGFLLDFGQALIERGANVLLIPEPTASASMISPPMFRRIVLPRLQKIVNELRVPCILHICGDTTSLLESMAQTGASVLSLDQCMDLAEARAVIPKAVLGGNVDPVNSLCMGTTEQVEADTLRSLSKGGRSRFILMSGCGIPPKTPVENIEAMVRTATKSTEFQENSTG